MVGRGVYSAERTTGVGLIGLISARGALAMLAALAVLVGCGSERRPQPNRAILCNPEHLLDLATPENGTLDSREEDSYRCMGERALQVANQSANTEQDAMAIVAACDQGFWDCAQRQDLHMARVGGPASALPTRRARMHVEKMMHDASPRWHWIFRVIVGE